MVINAGFDKVSHLISRLRAKTNNMNSINRKSITGVILSGGKNTRMGFNKAFLKIDGERLIDRTIKIFRELFSEIM